MAAPIFRIQNEALTTTLYLYDDNSIGNAIPTRQGFRDLDIRQNYATGDVGKIPIRLVHEFILSMDYVTAVVREQLSEWKFDRERVVIYNDSGETDPVAVALMETCLGRLYEIVSIPSIPLVLDGTTRFMGDIVFRQVWYTGTGVISYAEDV
jgi:hypothetical protein